MFECNQLSVLMLPTEQCNMNCIYCFNGDRRKTYSKVSLETVKKFYDIALPYLDYITFIWHGGEPLLMGLDFYKKAIELQKEYPNVQIKNRFQTNLTLLNDEWVEFFKENSIQVGSSHDGTLNDITRGNSDKIISNVSKLKENNMTHGVISVISSKNIDTMIRDYEYFKSLGLNYTTNLYVAGPDNTEDELELDAAHAIDKFCELYDYWLYDKESRTHLRFFELYIDYFMFGERNVCAYSSCLGRWMGLKNDGEIVPCNRTFPKEYSYGNISDYSKIQEAFESEGFKNLLIQSIQRRNKCKSCTAYEMCVGGCNNVAYNQGGVSENNGNFCTIFKGVYQYVLHSIKALIEKDDLSGINTVVRGKIERYKQQDNPVLHE